MKGKFLNYLDPSISLRARYQSALNDLRIPGKHRRGIYALLSPLKEKDALTYEHSIRVGLLAQRIGEFMHLDQKALFFAGLLHDIGKAQTRPETLQKTTGWTAEDAAEISSHVMDGYRMARGLFDFSAEVILCHHLFQRNGYPKKLPPPLHDYSQGTKTMIQMFGRILSLADVFDALHRVNDKLGETELTGETIKEKMFAFNQDQKVLIGELFKADILTTYLVPTK